MQLSPQEEILELLQRYTAFLADSTKNDSARFEAAKHWEQKFAKELLKIKRRDAKTPSPDTTSKSRIRDIPRPKKTNK